MGAFWDAWDKYDAQKSALEMQGIQKATGLAALMKQGQEAQMAQRVNGILGSDAPMETKLQGLLQAGAPGRQAAAQLMQMQVQQGAMQEQQQKVAKAKRVEDFWANEAPKFNTPAQPALQGNMTPGEGLTQRTGGLMSFSSGIAEDDGLQGILAPAKPAGVDLEGLLNRGAQVGAVNPEALVNHRSQQEARRDALLAREREWQTKLADTKLSRQEKAELTLQRDAEMAQRKEFEIRLMGALRQPAQPSPPVVVPDGNGGFKYVTREQAIGQPAPRPAADIRLDAGAKTLARQYFNDFEKDATVKRFKEITPAAEALVPYMESMAKLGAVSNNVADLNLTKLYLGVTRQKGENLTNMDKKGLAALAPVGTRIGQSLSGFFAGKDLSDDVRKDMWKTVAGHMAELKSAHDSRKAEFIYRAERAGLTADDVFKPEK